MPTYRLTATIPWYASAYRGPISQNTIYVSSDNVSTATQCAQAFANFYKAIGPTSLSADVFSGQLEISVYDMSQPKPRNPVAIVTDNFTLNQNNTMPGEVAIAISYRATRQSGEPEQRHRGRIYIGPVSVHTLGQDGRIGPNSLLGLTQVTQQLWQDLQAVNTSIWVCGSEEHGFRPITEFFINNEFDTIRRRQLDATDANRWDPHNV